MNLILLVQSTTDTANLKPALAGIAKLAPASIWVVHSPAVLVDMDAANSQTDAQIQAINAAIRDCIGREDYTGAESYKQQRHALTLQKATAATEGYKTMTAEQQEAATARVFGDFWAAKPAPKMGLTMHTQHFEVADWIEMLNSMKGRWAGEMKHGEYVVGWPGQFVESAASVVQAPQSIMQQVIKTATEALTAASEPPKPKAPKKGYLGSQRFKQLCSFGIDELGQTALSYQIDPNGMNRMKLAHAIGKHEEAKGLLEKAAL